MKTNKTLYIDMDGTLVEFRYKDKVIIDDWEDKGIFYDKKICLATIIGIVDVIKKKKEPFNEVNKIYVITQVPYSNFKHHCKNKKETFDIIQNIFKKQGIWLDGFIFVNTAEHKNKVECIQKTNNINESILIDDDHELLREFEKLGGISYHISSFL